jgi:hypothetical protein
MKWIDRRTFVAGTFRQVIITSAILILCQILAAQAQAQTILPMAVEHLLEQNAIRMENEPENLPSGTHIQNLDTALAGLWKASFLLEKSDSESGEEDGRSDDPTEEKKKRGSQTNPSGASGDTQLPQFNDERWSKRGGFNWDGALKQSFLFLGVQHAFRLATEEGTRAELKGPFFKDYFRSLRSLRGWGDGDPFLVNYIGHPMMGAVSGYIQIQNDPKGVQEEVSLKKSYWKSRMKAMGWSFFYSTQFELGLVSEATLGNIGIRPYGKAKNPMAYVDLVVTPVVGTGWLIGEDTLDKYFIRRYEDRLPNRASVMLFRSFLNPTRSFANVMRGKWPWYRDNRK